MNNNDDNAQHQKTSNRQIDVAIRIGMLAHGIIGLFIGAVVFVLGYTLFMVWLNGAET